MSFDQPKEATSFTKEVNKKFSEYLNFEDKQDFVDADRGLIAPVENPIQNLNVEDRLAPDTVNPSLWRNTQLQAKSGIYKVVEGIYQVRGLALATTVIVEGKTGIIVIDTLSGIHTAKAAIELYYEHRPKKPVVAIIISQSHADHFGGTESILEYAETSDIPIIVPEHFAKEAFSENVMLGPIMNRRAMYQFGLGLPQGDAGFLNAGIGSVFGGGQSGFVLPNTEITQEFQEMEVDGITFQFLLTPNTEAPAEMHFYIQNYKALFVSENANKTMHQIYTVRGAKTRDTLEWVKALDTTIDLFAESEIDALVMIHAWPVWGKEKAIEHLRMQRDLYKYIHDQTVRLANHGLTMEEIAETLELPDSLGKYWGNRGYYGTVQHNSKGVYNFYLGYYSGHPSDLDSLPQVDAGKKYVQYMGGAESVMKQAKADYEKGEYRWVAEVLKHVVMADSDNEDAKELLADTYEQLGYQAESANWRNIYLVGAQELRQGVRMPRDHKGMPKMVQQMPFTEFFKLLAVRLNGLKADGKRLTINLSLTDVEEDYTLCLDHSVLNKKDKLDKDPDVSLTTDKVSFYAVVLGGISLDEAIASQKLKLSGDQNKVTEFLSLFDKFSNAINIVTP